MTYMRQNGLPEESRVHCHGQGYNNVERPLIRGDETMAIAETMNIGYHPGILNCGCTRRRRGSTSSDPFDLRPALSP